MLHDHVARILVGDGQRWRVATGCVVPARDGGVRILTTRHKLFDGAFTIAEIEVRVRDQVRTSFELVWESVARDLAVLDCGDFAVAPPPLGALPSSTVPAQVRSIGFPAAGKQEDRTRRAIELSGRLYAGDPASDVVQLGIDDAPSGVDDWAGASGSPVFVDGALVAVIREVPTSFAGRRIDALAIERVLRAEPGLRAILREPEVRTSGPADETADRTRALIGRLSSVRGRTEELAALDRHVGDGNGLPLLLCAPGGTGKSALVAHWVESRSANAKLTVICHFFSQTERMTSGSEAYGHLLAQLGVMTEPARRGDETELRAELYARLKSWHSAERERWLVVVIDGLDEADRVLPPFPEPLPTNVAVIASLRAGSDEVPSGYEAWLARCSRLQLSGLGRDEIAAWLRSSPALGALADNAEFVTELVGRTGGFPLYLQFLLEDLELAAQRGAPATELASRPVGFSRYIQQQLAVVARDEAMRSKQLQRLFAVVAVAAEPLGEPDVEALTGLNVLELQNLPHTVTRWFTRRMVGPAIEYAFTHPLLAREFRRALGRLASDVEADLLAYCRRWPEHGSEFALRSLGAQLRSSERSDELLALARDEAYARAQRARPGGDRAHLRMLRHAIDAGIAASLWGATCELLLQHGAAVDDLVLASSPLALQDAGKLEQAIAVADLCAPFERVVWYLALAGRCFRAGDRASAHALLDKLAALRPEPVTDWQAEAIGAVLLGVLDDARDDFLRIARTWLSGDELRAVSVTSGLVDVLVARGDDKAALQLARDSRRRAVQLAIAIRGVKREGAAALPRARNVLRDVTRPARRVEALCTLGAALLERGDVLGRELFAEAHTYLEDSTQEDYARRYLAVAEWRADMTEDAMRTLGSIDEPFQRAYACIAIARAELDAGRNPDRWLADAELAMETLYDANPRLALSVLHERAGNTEAAERVQRPIRRSELESDAARAHLFRQRTEAGLFERALAMLPDLGGYRTAVLDHVRRTLIDRGRLHDLRRLAASSWSANTAFALAQAGHAAFACEVVTHVMVRFARASRRAPSEAHTALATIAAVVARQGGVEPARELMRRAGAKATRVLDLPAAIQSGDRAAAFAILEQSTFEQREVFANDIAGMFADAPEDMTIATWLVKDLAIVRTLRASLDRQLDRARRFAAALGGAFDDDDWRARRALAALIEAHVASGATADLYALFDAAPALIVPAVEVLGRTMDGPGAEVIARCERHGEGAPAALAGFAIGRLERGDKDTARGVIDRLAPAALHARTRGPDVNVSRIAVDLHVASTALDLEVAPQYRALALGLVREEDEDSVFMRMFRRFLELRDYRRGREAWDQIRDPFARGHALTALRDRPSLVAAAAPFVEVACAEITTRREVWVPTLVELLVEAGASAAVARLLPMGGESAMTACLMSTVVARAWPAHAAAIGDAIAGFCARATE